MQSKRRGVAVPSFSRVRCYDLPKISSRCRPEDQIQAGLRFQINAAHSSHPYQTVNRPRRPAQAQPPFQRHADTRALFSGNSALQVPQPTRKIDEVQPQCPFFKIFYRGTPARTKGQIQRRPIDDPWGSPQHQQPINSERREGQTYFPRTYHNSMQDLPFNGLLLYQPISKKDLVWNVGKHPSTAFSFDSDFQTFMMRDGPVLGLKVWTAYIHFEASYFLEQTYGPIIARTKGPHQPLTFGDLLDAIYSYFRHDTGYGQISSVMLRPLKANHWGQSLALGTWPKSGMRRVDLLYGHSRFKRIRLGYIDRRSWQCHLFLSLG